MDYAVQYGAYLNDLYCRWCLYQLAMCKRARQVEAFEQSGVSDVMVFPQEPVMSGEELGINFSLVKIEARAQGGKRPVVVIDPRAGRGGGISGSKELSQIGLSVAAGHPTYFITFAKEPLPGQTIEKVVKGTAVFVQAVAGRHSGLEPPAVIGNCQAGWQAALMAARYPDCAAGALVLVGAPLSYWSGSNSLSHAGMLSGGSWLASFLGDVGGGKVDGANFSGNFELNDLSVVMGAKHLSLFEDPSKENIERFLNNEKWWNRFYSMNSEEARFITERLFINNEPEKGELMLDGEPVSLGGIKAPIVAFASFGDSIASPSHALGWIPAVHASNSALCRSGQRIFYLLHPDCGHLAIFVSAKVADRYHRAIFEMMDRLESCPPGLYEIVLGAEAGPAIVPRRLEDITALDKSQAWERRAMERLAVRSAFLQAWYKTAAALAVKAFGQAMPEKAKRRLHPMRSTRAVYLPFAPAAAALEPAAQILQDRRIVAGENNLFKQAEEACLGSFLRIWEWWERSQKICLKFAAGLL